MNDHELWETTMDPTTRILKQVTLDEAADADETFSILMATTSSSGAPSSSATQRTCASWISEISGSAEAP